jgi:hypothetical protein
VSAAIADGDDRAFEALRLLAEFLECLVEALDLLFGLFKMVSEALGERPCRSASAAP